MKLYDLILILSKPKLATWTLELQARAGLWDNYKKVSSVEYS